MRLILLSFTAFLMINTLQAFGSIDGHLIEVPEKEFSIYIDEIQWRDFKTDECQVFDSSISNEEKLRSLGLRRCRDKSISYVQPTSRGAGGWEGKCGQTFGANSLFMLCQLGVDPSSYFKSYFRDLTPGVRPSTLRKGMNRISKRLSENCFTDRRDWEVSYASSAQDYIQMIENQLEARMSLAGQIKIHRNGKNYFVNPVGALIQNPGGNYLHWVTIIDILQDNNSCKFVVNHWDNQYQVPCDIFASWSRNVGMAYPIILKSYSLVTYK